MLSLQIIYLCIFQYCFIRVFFTIVSVITEVADRYCEDSLSPAFAHVWVTCFEGASVSIAMYALIQFYFELRTDLKQHKPFLKLLCIKLVIFLSFWQTVCVCVFFYTVPFLVSFLFFLVADVFDFLC